MALQSMGMISWPGVMEDQTSGPAFSTAAQTLNAAGEYHAFVFPAREAMTISHVGVNLAVTSAEVDIRIETVDATTGVPTGTLWDTNTNIVTSGLTANWNLHALTASASISAGQVFALKVLYSSGTSVSTRSIGRALGTRVLPYQVPAVPTPTRGLMANAFNLCLGSSTTTFYRMYGILPASAATNNITFTNTNSAKKGIRFQVPFKCRCIGLKTYLSTQMGDYSVMITDDSGTELSSSSTTYEGDVREAGNGMAYNFFDNPVTLSSGTWYRAFVAPSSATALRFDYWTAPSADYLTAWPGGSNYYLAEYDSVGGHTTNTASVPAMDLLIDQLDDGTGGAHFSAAYG